MRILITGINGFIGYHLAIKLKTEGHDIVGGVDNINYDYDPILKGARRRSLWHDHKIDSHVLDIKSQGMLDHFRHYKPDMVIHLAASAGVRTSMSQAQYYIDNNIRGTQNIIDVCEKTGIQNVIYASTSCVMSGCPTPWNEEAIAKRHLSPYAYSKATNEHQFYISKIPNVVGLRFFTVYGPWGRPDMALYQFVKNIKAGNPITIYNNGNLRRDFTYIDDIIQGINIVVNNMSPRDIYCLGYGKSVPLMDFVKEIENHLGPAEYKFEGMHPADAVETWSDTSKIQKLGYKPTVPIEVGIDRFIKWYKEYQDNESLLYRNTGQ